MIIPTVGRVVWFWGSTDGRLQEQPYAALVAFVWHDRMVNLSVFDQDGTQMPMTSVPLVQDGDERPAGGYFCEWMPYQKSVAKGEIAPVLHATSGTGCTLTIPDPNGVARMNPPGHPGGPSLGGGVYPGCPGGGSAGSSIMGVAGEADEPTL